MQNPFAAITDDDIKDLDVKTVMHDIHAPFSRYQAGVVRLKTSLAKLADYQETKNVRKNIDKN